MSDTSSPDPVSTSIDEGVLVVRLDDGKVNVVSHRVIELLHAALDDAAASASSVAIIGREGKLSAGFDLTEMTAGIERTQALVGAGGRLLMRIYGHPQPVVLGVTGHALAAGALLTLACDTRIGGDGPAKIGLNETAIGMGLPHYAVELAQARITPAHLVRAAVQAEIYDAPGAVEAGYLDRVVPAADVASATIAEARRLGELPGRAYGHTKLALHQALIDRVVPRIDEDMRRMTAPTTSP